MRERTVERQLLEKLIQNQQDIFLTLKKVNQELAMMKQDMNRALGYLENDKRTNTKGLVESYNDLEKRVSKLEVSGKITKSKIALVLLIVTSLGGVISFLLNVFKLNF